MESYEYIEALKPVGGETDLTKFRSSAFSSDAVLEVLEQLECTSVAVIGFTGADCVAATATQGISLGFDVHVIEDATVTFGIAGPDGKQYSCTEVHELTMATLHAGNSHILATKDLG